MNAAAAPTRCVSFQPPEAAPGKFRIDIMSGMLPSEEAAALPAPGNRWISLFEVLLGAFIVIGHNVFHVVPNEVPILLLLFWLSPRLRTGKWDLSGLRRPPSWWKTIGIAVVAAAVKISVSEFAVQPLAARFCPQPQHVSSVLTMSAMGWKSAALSLALVWTFAAFGEELSYRGYLLKRAADLGRGSSLACLFAMLYVSVLFGFGHFYKVPQGSSIPHGRDLCWVRCSC